VLISTTVGGVQTGEVDLKVNKREETCSKEGKEEMARGNEE